MNKISKKTSWKWFAVKQLFYSEVSGDPNTEEMKYDESINFCTYEETIFLIKAQSFEHAYKLAEKKSKENETEYFNVYNQLIRYRFVKSLDAFELFDDIISSGTELYSRFIHVPKNEKLENILKHYYPESVENDDLSPDYYYKYRNSDFNSIENLKN